MGSPPGAGRPPDNPAAVTGGVAGASGEVAKGAAYRRQSHPRSESRVTEAETSTAKNEASDGNICRKTEAPATRENCPEASQGTALRRSNG